MYKAILQEKPKLKFFIEEISDEDNKGWINGTYSYVHSEPYSLGTFVVKKTKQGAINAIKKHFKKRINDCEKEIVKLNKLLSKIEV